MSNECNCKDCKFKYMLKDFDQKCQDEHNDVIDVYLKTLNDILQGWNQIEPYDFFADCQSYETKLNLDSALTKKFLSFFPGRTIMDKNNIKNMSLKLKNLPNRIYDLSTKNVYKRYISEYIQNITEEEVIYISIIHNLNVDENSGIYLTLEERIAIQKIYMEMDLKLEKIVNENKDLKTQLTHYQYMPGGPGYNDAKSEFEINQKK